jgi:hypothetical protein
MALAVVVAGGSQAEVAIKMMVWLLTSAVLTVRKPHYGFLKRASAMHVVQH